MVEVDKNEYGTPDFCFNISNQESMEIIEKVTYLMNLDFNIVRFIKDVLGYDWQSEDKKYYACFVLGRLIEKNDQSHKIKSQLLELRELIQKEISKERD